MKEAGPSDICDGRPDLLPCVDHIHTECIDCISADVIAVHTRYQHFALVIVHKQSANHRVSPPRICCAFCARPSDSIRSANISYVYVRFKSNASVSARQSDAHLNTAGYVTTLWDDTMNEPRNERIFFGFINNRGSTECFLCNTMSTTQQRQAEPHCSSRPMLLSVTVSSSVGTSEMNRNKYTHFPTLTVKQFNADGTNKRTALGQPQTQLNQLQQHIFLGVCVHCLQ